MLSQLAKREADVPHLQLGELDAAAAWTVADSADPAAPGQLTAAAGDSMCRATNVDYRVDTASARAFLSHYVTLP